MDLQIAVDRFREAILRANDLVLVHRQLGTLRAAAHAVPTTRGRRQEEVSINGAVVVLVVGAWQAVVEDLTTACLDLGTPPPGGPMLPATYSAITGPARHAIGQLNTPNAENTRRLMRSAGFDPFPFWTWSQSAGAHQPAKTISPAVASDTMNSWLKVRHLVAHGQVIEQVKVLDAVKEKEAALAPAALPAGWSPTIRLTDAERCMAFFRRTTRLTSVALAGHLALPAPTWT